MKCAMLPSKGLAGLLMLSFFSFNAIAQATNARLNSDITAANNKWCDLFSQGGDLSTLYAADAIVCPPNSDFVRGSDAIRTFFKGAFDAGMKKVKLETVSLDPAGNMATETGKYIVYGADDKVADSGKYVVT